MKEGENKREEKRKRQKDEAHMESWESPKYARLSIRVKNFGARAYFGALITHRAGGNVALKPRPFYNNMAEERTNQMKRECGGEVTENIYIDATLASGSYLYVAAIFGR